MAEKRRVGFDPAFAKLLADHSARVLAGQRVWRTKTQPGELQKSSLRVATLWQPVGRSAQGFFGGNTDFAGSGVRVNARAGSVVDHMRVPQAVDPSPAQGAPHMDGGALSGGSAKSAFIAKMMAKNRHGTFAHPADLARFSFNGYKVRHLPTATRLAGQLGLEFPEPESSSSEDEVVRAPPPAREGRQRYATRTAGRRLRSGVSYHGMGGSLPALHGGSGDIRGYPDFAVLARAQAYQRAMGGRQQTPTGFQGPESMQSGAAHELAAGAEDDQLRQDLLDLQEQAAAPGALVSTKQNFTAALQNNLSRVSDGGLVELEAACAAAGMPQEVLVQLEQEARQQNVPQIQRRQLVARAVNLYRTFSRAPGATPADIVARINEDMTVNRILRPHQDDYVPAGATGPANSAIPAAMYTDPEDLEWWQGFDTSDPASVPTNIPRGTDPARTPNRAIDAPGHPEDDRRSIAAAVERLRREALDARERGDDDAVERALLALHELTGDERSGDVVDPGDDDSPDPREALRSLRHYQIVATRRGDTDWLQRLNAAVEQLEETGTISNAELFALRDKSSPEGDAEAPLPRESLEDFDAGEAPDDFLRDDYDDVRAQQAQDEFRQRTRPTEPPPIGSQGDALADDELASLNENARIEFRQRRVPGVDDLDEDLEAAAEAARVPGVAEAALDDAEHAPPVPLAQAEAAPAAMPGDATQDEIAARADADARAEGANPIVREDGGFYPNDTPAPAAAAAAEALAGDTAARKIPGPETPEVAAAAAASADRPGGVAAGDGAPNTGDPMVTPEQRYVLVKQEYNRVASDPTYRELAAKYNNNANMTPEELDHFRPLRALLNALKAEATPLEDMLRIEPGERLGVRRNLEDAFGVAVRRVRVRSLVRSPCTRPFRFVQ